MIDLVRDDVDGVRRSTARLFETLERLDDETAQQPSLLPGWTVAMLVTHVARNADSHVNACEGAMAGEVRRRYPSVEAREAGIAAGRGRTAADVVADLRRSVERLDDAWEAMTDEAWLGQAISGTGAPEPLVELPLGRWREVELHHVDLGLGFDVEELDERFVAKELQLWMGRLESRLPPGTGARITASDTGRVWRAGGDRLTMQVEAPSRSLLAWLTGRRTEGFPEIGEWDW